MALPWASARGVDEVVSCVSLPSTHTTCQPANTNAEGMAAPLGSPAGEDGGGMSSHPLLQKGQAAVWVGVGVGWCGVVCVQK